MACRAGLQRIKPRRGKRLRRNRPKMVCRATDPPLQCKESPSQPSSPIEGSSRLLRFWGKVPKGRAGRGVCQPWSRVGRWHRVVRPDTRASGSKLWVMYHPVPPGTGSVAQGRPPPLPGSLPVLVLSCSGGLWYVRTPCCVQWRVPARSRRCVPVSSMPAGQRGKEDQGTCETHGAW